MKWETIKELITWIIGLFGLGSAAFWLNPKGWFRAKKAKGELEEVKITIEQSKAIREELKAIHHEMHELQKTQLEIRNELFLVKIENMELKATLEMRELELKNIKGE